MKRTLLHGITALLTGFIFSVPANAAPCSADFINTEKNLYKVYQTLRETHDKCRYSGADYLNFGKRAYLAERYGESLWALEYGISQKNSESIQMELYYTRGLAYLGRGRNEEAISSLKKVAMQNNAVSAVELETRQRAHLALIKAYYEKSGSRDDANVKFLTNLFRRRYPRSRYLPVLDKWLQDAPLP